MLQAEIDCSEIDMKNVYYRCLNLENAMKILKLTMVFFLVVLSSSAFAGFDGNSPGECFSEPATPKTVTCRGTMAGVRNQVADPTRQTYFLKGILADGSFWLAFSQVTSNKAFLCNPPLTQQWLDIWDTAMASNAYYWIQFDTNTGICKSIVLMNGSSFKNKSAL
jgi:hypothetical protein